MAQESTEAEDELAALLYAELAELAEGDDDAEQEKAIPR